jgi:hypothetical protein
MDAGEFLKSLGKLSSRAMSEYTQNMERYARLVGGMAQQAGTDSNPAKTQERYAEFVRAESGRVAGALATASLNYYTAVLDVGIETATRFFDQFGKSEAPKHHADSSSLLFHGMQGDWCGNAFRVSNSRNEPVEVRFEVTEAMADNATAVRPTVKFTPEACLLKPKSEQIVQCALLLSDEFMPGQTYLAQIRAVGFPEMTVKISIQAEESAAPSATLNAPKRKTRKR